MVQRLQRLADFIKFRAMPGTRERVLRAVKDSRGWIGSESEFYRGAVYKYLLECEGAPARETVVQRLVKIRRYERQKKAGHKGHR